MYAQKIKEFLNPKERKVFAKLTSPKKIQDFLDATAINFEEKGETFYSPRRVLRERKAHCIEGALFAAAVLGYHGYPPLLLDFQTLPSDEDHVITVFKEESLWGAISMTNHMILQWRDPIYKNIRELAMSYFHEYFLHDGKKSFRTFSKPFDLRRYPVEKWLIAEKNLNWLAEDLDASPHFPVLPKKMIPRLRKVTPFELQILKFTRWAPPKKKKAT